MDQLPTGTVTFLYTDIEGSTARWERAPTVMRPALERHDAILRESIAAAGGVVFRTMGDAFCGAFPTASQAAGGAVTAQRALAAEPWPAEIGAIRARMALHTGTGELGGGDYIGPPLNRVARILSAGYGGQVLCSQTTADLLRGVLAEGVSLRDLGEHRLKDLQLPERLFQFVIADLPADFPPLKSLNVHAHNLPAERAPLVGREREIAAVLDLLRQPQTRMVTLTGPGGTGKTRLALHVAAEVSDRCADGVYFVPLAPVTDPQRVPAAIAQALELKEVASQEPIATLEAFLRDKQMLLVLDNFEQVVPAAPLVGRLLGAAPRLRVLTTSREILRLYGEQEFPVPGLAVPDVARLPPLAALARFEAIALFVERARLVQPAFGLTDQNAAAVAEICCRLDGLPLAIELAAARVRLLSPQAISTRLARSLELLTSGARDLPARQQTLRGAIQWGYDLLSVPEQCLFRRLSVFVGGCTLEEAEAICAGDAGPEMDLFEGIASLTDKSLLKQEVDSGGEPRFHMLETIREFATELLESCDEAETMRRRLAIYLHDLTASLRPQLIGVGQQDAVERLDQEHENLRAALGWAIAAGERDIALPLVGVSMLWHFWRARCYFREGLQWTERALALTPPDERTYERAAAMLTAAWLAWRLQQSPTVARYAGETRTLFADLLAAAPGDVRVAQGLAHALLLTALVRGFREGVPSAELIGQALALFNEQGDLWGHGFAHLIDGLIANALGDAGAARETFAESEGHFHRVGDIWGEAQAANGQADAARILGDNEAAGRFYEHALRLYRDLKVRADIPSAQHNLAYVALARGDAATARTLMGEALEQQLALQNTHGVTECLAGLAAVAAVAGMPDRAARLFGAAAALREATGAQVWPAERAENARYAAFARDQVDEPMWAAAWEAGRLLSEGGAIALARETPAG